MEMMVNKYSNVEKYPQIGRAMEAYGRVRGPKNRRGLSRRQGLMRSIPIEKAIEGETRRASYEEVSKYLTRTTYSPCRTVRAARRAKSWAKAAVT
jgi:hypothetical protein